MTFTPAAIDLHPSVSIAWVKTVAQVVPGNREETLTYKINALNANNVQP